MIDVKVFWGFALRLTDERTNERTDICDCRVAFATENIQVDRKYLIVPVLCKIEKYFKDLKIFRFNLFSLYQTV